MTSRMSCIDAITVRTSLWNNNLRPMSAPRFFVPFLLLMALGAVVCAAAADERAKVWVTLADKGPGFEAPPSAGRPEDVRRYEDAPVYAPYVQTLRASGFDIATSLKWQNKISGWVDGAQREALALLPFVRRVEEVPQKGVAFRPAAPPGSPSAKAAAAPQDFGAFTTLFRTVGATALRDTVAHRNLKPGAGVAIAVMDADFY